MAEQHVKDKIIELRKQNNGYVTIAKMLEISKKTVRLRCMKHGLDGVMGYVSPQKKFLCKHCDQQYVRTKTYTNTTYCSVECKHQYNASIKQQKQEAKKLLHLKSCVTCGMEFKINGTQKYCSKECGIVETKCECCGIVFAKSRDVKTKHCSHECASESRKKNFVYSDKEISKKIRVLANEGKSTRIIAREMGLSRDQVKTFFNRYNISNGLNFSKGTVEIVPRVHEKTDGRCRYVSGYKSVDKPIKIACNICNTETTIGAQFLRRNKEVQCSYCNSIESNRRKELKAKLLHKKKIEKYIQTHKVKLKIFKNKCSYCGKETVDNKITKYCSKQCVRRINDLKKSDARRERIELNGSKENITLPRLFKRDKGVCHICKGKCDYNDYEIKGNVFYAKDNYPSRDHVIPLSKGGTHTWDNVKLAHMRCNTVKNNNTSLVIDKGRLRLDL